LDTLADQVIAPVMRRVGHEWSASGSTSGRSIVARSSSPPGCKTGWENSPRLPRSLALGAAPAGDPYSLGLFLGQMAPIDSGWRVINLEPNTPLLSLTVAMERLQPRLVWLSGSYLAAASRFFCNYRQLHSRPANRV
jgi:hypothetical protein